LKVRKDFQKKDKSPSFCVALPADVLLRRPTAALLT
jgi:hypothetical protein